MYICSFTSSTESNIIALQTVRQKTKPTIHQPTAERSKRAPKSTETTDPGNVPSTVKRPEALRSTERPPKTTPSSPRKLTCYFMSENINNVNFYKPYILLLHYCGQENLQCWMLWPRHVLRLRIVHQLLK